MTYHRRIVTLRRYNDEHLRQAQQFRIVSRSLLSNRTRRSRTARAYLTPAPVVTAILRSRDNVNITLLSTTALFLPPLRSDMLPNCSQPNLFWTPICSTRTLADGLTLAHAGCARHGLSRGRRRAIYVRGVYLTARYATYVPLLCCRQTSYSINLSLHHRYKR